MLQMFSKMSIFWDGGRKTDLTNSCSELDWSVKHFLQIRLNVYKDELLEMYCYEESRVKPFAYAKVTQVKLA